MDTSLLYPKVKTDPILTRGRADLPTIFALAGGVEGWGWNGGNISLTKEKLGGMDRHGRHSIGLSDYIRKHFSHTFAMVNSAVTRRYKMSNFAFSGNIGILSPDFNAVLFRRKPKKWHR